MLPDLHTDFSKGRLNLWDAVKAVLRRKFIAIQFYLKKQEKHQIDNLTLHLKQLEKEEEKNPKIKNLQASKICNKETATHPWFPRPQIT